MALESIYYVSQILAAIAIAASLLFVGLQLRQNDRTQRATIHQIVGQRTMDTTKFYFTDDHADVLAKMSEGARELSSHEIMVVLGMLRINLLNLQEALWQQRHGLLDDDVVKGALASSRRLYASTTARVAVNFFASTFSDEQHHLMAEMGLLDQPLQVATNLPANWRKVFDEMFPLNS